MHRPRRFVGEHPSGDASSRERSRTARGSGRGAVPLQSRSDDRTVRTARAGDEPDATAVGLGDRRRACSPVLVRARLSPGGGLAANREGACSVRGRVLHCRGATPGDRAEVAADAGIHRAASISLRSVVVSAMGGGERTVDQRHRRRTVGRRSAGRSDRAPRVGGDRAARRAEPAAAPGPRRLRRMGLRRRSLPARSSPLSRRATHRARRPSP
jgi:hypothetical protein